MKLVTHAEKVIETLDLPPEYLGAMQRILELLQYPVSPDGTVFDVSFISAPAAYHLARGGVDVVRAPLIKKRPVSGPGIIQGACEWVRPDESSAPVVYSSPLDDLENMTMAQINALPEPLRGEARRRLGLPYEEPGWQQVPVVNIEDAPEPDDGAEWIGE